MKGGEEEDDYWKERREERDLKTERGRERTLCVYVCVWRNRRDMNVFI